MGSGLLVLTAKGKQNLYLNVNPNITFFKMAYRRHTNFSSEIIPQYFKTTPNFGNKVTVSISKNADLMSQIYLYVKLPSITKFYHSILPDNIKKFRWVEKIGWALIKTIDIELGGVLIDRHYGDWLNIWDELTRNSFHLNGINKMIGNQKELFSPTNGKDSFSLYIPLNFWFCQNIGLALPLIALIHNDIKIHVEFNSFSKCYIEEPTHYINVDQNFSLFKFNEEIYQNINGTIARGRFIYFDTFTKRLYYEKWINNFLHPTLITQKNKYIIQGNTTNFKVTPILNDSIKKDDNYFNNNYPSIIESYILINYIYLDNPERIRFLNSNHEYLINTLQIVPETIIYSNNSSIKLKFVHPCKQLIWRLQMDYNYKKNDLFNYSINPDISKNEIILSEIININGKNRNDIDFYKYYQLIQNYKYSNNSPSIGIHSYSFSIYPYKYQPSGTFNFSKIDDSTLILNLDRKISYQNFVRIKIYAINYNLLRIDNGLGGLVFSR